MKKVGLTRSIHLKFVMIYVLLILLAMQIIGVYFVRELENKLVDNFQSSIKSRVDLLEYSVREEMVKERAEDDPSKENEIKNLLEDSAEPNSDIYEIRVVDDRSRIIGTSDENNQAMVGRPTNEISVKRVLAGGGAYDNILIDEKTGDRVWVLTSPIISSDEVIGAIYLVAKIENVYNQMNEINKIFTNGTLIALAITAILGVLLAQTITRPISDMRKHALAMAKGNFSRKVKVYGYDEIGQLAMTFNNLTKRLQEAQATTEGERRKLSSVLSYMTDGVIATDRKGRVILINDPAVEMLNVSRETVLSQPIVALLGLDEEYTFEDLSNEQDSIILDYSTKEKPYILRANFSIIQKETGFVNGLITVLHDITEQEKIDLERREFVANVSHELRTPLTTMRSYLEALAEGAWQDEEIAPQFLNVTQTETERMIRLVNDLLQLSKMDSKDYRFNKDWIDFILLFHRIIDRFEMTKNLNVTFERYLPDQAMFVEIDTDKITQVLDNIISNALKYSPEGGTITFNVKENNGFIEISVSDQGLGIPKENLDKVFERFYRVDKARSRQMGGTGLGLAIAKEMITAHGGDIWATSVEGKGTTITFTLPFDSAQEDDWS
ncbi:PAS domain-containing sensor histidine kinase [[Bacillus] enclensis]|uniref:histidine kinase n=1 Tax=[Bacillus] enclensis TaxID=1402860 RepID=A0A0V8H9D6_9BACI|nr:cell wall metabolism sensor histidine kinase WalK [[Bacillus] enclensis]KSU59070.1 PAS domain-containing sensor histidine kinase [[Bacillus] enclensis]OAT85664.1 PAS domain-containing sensor histidine kinase [Bacillus sp. MKU004]QWC22835.1 cell wall metabolism sensor histidine kinase WalK [Bacillus haikouensis]SCC32049.1 two-component system, OmpR family, sensor histidine kinase VicK [[Bacillus] enclensis]